MGATGREQPHSARQHALSQDGDRRLVKNGSFGHRRTETSRERKLLERSPRALISTRAPAAIATWRRGGALNAHATQAAAAAAVACALGHLRVRTRALAVRPQRSFCSPSSGSAYDSRRACANCRKPRSTRNGRQRGRSGAGGNGGRGRAAAIRARRDRGRQRPHRRRHCAGLRGGASSDRAHTSTRLQCCVASGYRTTLVVRSDAAAAVAQAKVDEHVRRRAARLHADDAAVSVREASEAAGDVVALAIACERSTFACNTNTVF